jgi:chitinase
MSYSTYFTTWNKNPYDEIQELINNKVLKSNTRVILAFASFNFNSTNYIPGLGNMTLTDVSKVTNLVHSNGGKISLSIGGATYPFTGSDLYSRPGDLASNINFVLNNCGFDGVDFDIEDESPAASDFVNNAASLINTLRSLNSGLNISLTTAAQGWNASNYQQSLINLTIGSINAWQPMEYDLWIDPSSNYYNQIMYDINFYVNTWNVNPNKIILGLMPGKDDGDSEKDLTLQYALDLTMFAKSKGLQGVMTWDANIDSTGVDGNAPYAYSLGIQATLGESEENRKERSLKDAIENRNIVTFFYRLFWN